MGVCYIVIAIACCVFYAVTGLRLTKLMRKASKELMASSRVKRLTRVGYLSFCVLGHGYKSGMQNLVLKNSLIPRLLFVLLRNYS
jgi:hypothetical protein